MASHFAKVFSAELEGVEARLVEVETDINAGLHSFTIVGLADKALSEAKERVSAALKNSGTKPPTKENRKIVVNLAPADVHKTGSQYDLAIAVGYLMATGQMQAFFSADVMLVGELSLEGVLRPVSGALNFATLAHKLGFRSLVVPSANAAEAALVAGIAVIPVATLREAIDYLEGRQSTAAYHPAASALQAVVSAADLDLGAIKGQENAKRALVIAAAGGHNLLMVGSPGGGKTMIAQALISILPALTTVELIEITKIYSAAGLLVGQPLMNQRPFRAPHQTASSSAVIGGGSPPHPGEISLAHCGVLFLDELPEFRRDLLESLRQPLESGFIAVSRAKKTVIFPARFTLVAAMNPCPCGYGNDEERQCRCTAHEIARYQKKISGPLLDRIDLQITVPRVTVATLRRRPAVVAESARLREEVAAARLMQSQRLGSGRTNAAMSSPECDRCIHLHASAQHFIETVITRSLLSARGYYRVLKTAQTIADLEAASLVTEAHLAEAFSYRMKDEILDDL